MVIKQIQTYKYEPAHIGAENNPMHGIHWKYSFFSNTRSMQWRLQWKLCTYTETNAYSLHWVELLRWSKWEIFITNAQKMSSTDQSENNRAQMNCAHCTGHTLSNEGREEKKWKKIARGVRNGYNRNTDFPNNWTVIFIQSRCIMNSIRQPKMGKTV